jgi:uncharacterized protein
MPCPFRVACSVVAALSVLSCSATPVVVREPEVGAIARLPFEVDLGGWTSAGEIAHPAPGGVHGGGPWPVVLLIHGNGPHDMDVTLPGPNGGTKLFAAIANVVASRGFAVVRYHKRFVKGPGRFDARFWREQSTIAFAADARRVLDTALAMPPCDRDRVFLWGWSEGTAVAAAVAVGRSDVAGLVLQGAVGLPWREMVRGWILDVGLPYAQSPGGGPVTAESLAVALRGNGGIVAKLGASFFADPATIYSAHPMISALLDKDGDGRLDPDREVRGAAEAMLDFAFGPTGNVHVYADGRTVPTVTEQAGRLQQPVLILQGENDASTPVAGGRNLATALRAAGNDAELWELPGRGHTLGPAASLIDDCGRPPDDATFVRVASWLAEHSASQSKAVTSTR